jgi:TrmH family RNA methyltransferase
VEGLKLCGEFLKSIWKPVAGFFTPAMAEIRAASLIQDLTSQEIPITFLNDEVMAFASDLDSPPGVILIGERPVWDVPSLLKKIQNPLVVVLDGAQTPSNVGAVVRAAEGAGALAVLQTRSGADPLGPKTLRASAGSSFRLPVAAGPGWVDILKQAGLTCVAADAQGETPYTDFPWKQSVALFLGGETGFSDERIRSLPTLRIPLQSPVESLNVAVAAGVCLFEAARQRAL